MSDILGLGFTPPPATKADLVRLTARIKQLEYTIDALNNKIKELILLVNRQSQKGSNLIKN